jgi:hypothetical protein
MSNVEERSGEPECAKVEWWVKNRNEQTVTTLQRILNIMPLVSSKYDSPSYPVTLYLGKQKDLQRREVGYGQYHRTLDDVAINTVSPLLKAGY